MGVFLLTWRFCY